jgi:hypothetical protein
MPPGRPRPRTVTILMRGAIRRHMPPGRPRPRTVTNCNEPWMPEMRLVKEAIRGHQRQSEAINEPWMPEMRLVKEAIRGHQRQSEAINEPWMPEMRLVKRRETAPGSPDRIPIGACRSGLPDRIPISAFPPLLCRGGSRARRRERMNPSLVDSLGAVSGAPPSGTSTARESAMRVARPSATSHRLPSRTCTHRSNQRRYQRLG